MGILHLNCFSIEDSSGKDLATALFGMGSFLNHSCDPNVELAPNLESRTSFATFRALREIQSGEEVTNFSRFSHYFLQILFFAIFHKIS